MKNIQPKEYIICSAVIVRDDKKHKGQPINIMNGFVVAGRRHIDCLNTLEATIGYEEMKKLVLDLPDEDYRRNQGFLTNHNKFVSRKHAMIIAYKANQLVNPSLHEENGQLMDKRELTSEDLFGVD